MSISREQYRKTEGHLYRYARTVIRIAAIEAEMAEIDRQITDLSKQAEYWLAHNPRVTGNYDLIGCVGGKDPDNTPVERAMIDGAARRLHLQHLLATRQHRRSQLRDELYELRMLIARIDEGRRMLGQEDAAIFEQRYIYERTNGQIGEALGYTEGGVRRRLRQIVKKMYTIIHE